MNKELSELCEIRDGLPEDEAFIKATFLRGTYYGNSFFLQVPKDIFMDNYKLVVDAVWRKSITKVVCLKEDPNVILGYSILSPDYQTVHWTYVKLAWRQKGIAKALLPQYPKYFSHLTETGQKLMLKLPTAVFNPFSL